MLIKTIIITFILVIFVKSQTNIDMTKLKAIILWPYVYFLDILVSVFTDQTFKRSRAISKIYYNRIVNSDNAAAAEEKAKQSELNKKSIFGNPFRVNQDA